MTTRNRRTSQNLSVFALLGSLAASPAYADDTEIYTGANNLNATVDPNVMFIIDTSGSMNASEFIVSDPYDPSQTYTGSCSSSRIYWSSSGNPPTCSTSAYFEKSKFRCDAAETSLFDTTNGTGFYQDRVARFRAAGFFSSAGWTSLSTSVRNPPHVECKADEGVHGENDTSTAVYIRNDSQAYTTNFNQRRNWNNTGSFRTLFSANYVNWFHSPGTITSQRRIDIVKDAVKALVDANTNLNISLMRFNTNGRGGRIIYPFTDIDGSGVKADFKNTVSGLSASGVTPLSETLSEALRIYRGDGAFFGVTPQTSSGSQSVVGAFENNNRSDNYNTPLDVQCQKNFIVYLSDGSPVSDSEANTFINGLVSGASLPSGDTSCGGSDNCLDELAEFMNETDLISGLDGKQSVVTYTIGFGSGVSGSLTTLLTQTGVKGGGNSYLAKDFRELSNAFTQIITEIQAVNTTFTAPAVSVNAFNRVTNREELFFTLFKPAEEPIWTGNIKRYRIGQELDGSGNPVDSNGDGIPDTPIVLDGNGDPAVDSQTGFFATSSTSFWTTTADAPDGDETGKGGAARLFAGGDVDPALSRTIYTNFGTTGLLTDSTNQVNKDNASLTAALIGLTGATGEPTRDELLNWLSGIDVKDEDGDGSTTDSRRVMGDPLHTKPLLVEYAPAPTTANPNPASDITIYMSTNEGIMHGINATNGSEVFSFIPKQQLERSFVYFANSSTGFKDYGLDGPMTLYFKDTNGNGFLDSGAPDSDRYILIFGERRGGNRYYAVDVTDRTQPQFLWHIVGGTGDFHELGQTWSAPQQARIKLNGVEKDVLVFGGGYDEIQDGADNARSGDTKGRAIYMVDPLTGALVWWAGKAGVVGSDTSNPVPANLTNLCAVSSSAKNCSANAMNFAIPADLRLVDIDADGLLDRIYASDMGAQLMRVDIDNEGNTGAGSLADGYIIADLQRATASSVPVAKDNRRFYFAPDVALFTEDVDTPFISIAIGSGYRSHPLNTTVEDKFYMVQDKSPFSKPATYEDTFSEANLKDVTNDLSPDLTGFDGWFIKLVDTNGNFAGQKVLSVATTFSGTILFTTFTPVAGASANSCAPNQGTGQVFGVSAIDASPTTLFTQTGGGTSTGDQRVIASLTRTGIPPEVTILFPPGSTKGKPVALVAAEKLELDLSNVPEKTYWFELEQD